MAAAALDAPDHHAELGAHPDHGLLQPAHMGDDIDGGRQVHDRVADQLARSMPRDLAAAVHVDDLGSIPGALVWLGPLGGGEDVLML